MKKSEEIPIVIVGNRCDVEQEREVYKEEGKEYAQKYNVSFIETSAKLGINVKHAF